MAKFTRMIPLLCALFLLCLCGCHQNIPDTTSSIEETQSPTVKSTYPQTPDSLATMSNRDLVELLASSSHLVNVFLFYSISEGVSIVRRSDIVLDELLKRDGGIEAINDYLMDESVEDLPYYVRIALEDLYYVLGSAVFQGTLDYPA